MVASLNAFVIANHTHLIIFQMTFLTRFLSRKDIGVIVTFGCPSLDRKVINSGKRLRAYAGIDEGNVGDLLLFFSA